MWDYGPATAYEVPEPPSTEKVGSGLRALWRGLRNGHGHVDRPAEAEAERPDFAPLPGPVLATVLPEFPREAAAESLAGLLDPWLAEASPSRVGRVVIGPPGSGVAEVVALWGERRGARRIEPPPQERLLEIEPGWWRAADPDDDGLQVIPDLERFYLRHHAGLELVRGLVERLWLAPRRIVVGCESWAWAYLCRALQVDAVFAPPLAPKPLDGPALRGWLRPRPAALYRVRRARDGEGLYPADDGEDDPAMAAAGSDLFQRIAATSRGIPAVARALWEHGLGEAEAEDAGAEPDRPRVIRVQSPQDQDLPSIPAATTREAVVLHTLLLHSGLPSALLCRLVPFPASAVVGLLARLKAAGLVAEEDGRWRVTPLGYPAVRAFLSAEGLLIDAFRD